jgi:pyruvate formate lyase activating enzyme
MRDSDRGDIEDVPKVQSKSGATRVVASGRVHEQDVRRIGERVHCRLEQRALSERQQAGLVGRAGGAGDCRELLSESSSRPGAVARAAGPRRAALETAEASADACAGRRPPERRVRGSERELRRDQLSRRRGPRPHDCILPAAQWSAVALVSETVPTKYWHRLEDGRIQCDVCPRACKLREGQRGLCFVRAREDDEIVLTTYGRSSGFCVDPIEKKPLNHFLPGSSVLSFGTAGCNLACRFCQNWDISKSREIDTLADAASPDGIAAAAEALGCASVAFTYNDPVIFLEYAIDVADACRERGIRAVAVTAGYICPEPRVELYAHMDAANVDLKAFTESFYTDTCAGHLAPVLETLEYLRHETDVWFEITNLLIPELNDSDAEIDAMTRWVVDRLGPDVPMHFTAFHPDYKLLDRPPTPAATLTRAREIALGNGVRFAYTGNVHDIDGGSSFCAGCGTRVIERDWYELGDYKLTDEGRCEACGTQLPGEFAGRPGGWGRRRLPVRLSLGRS